MAEPLKATFFTLKHRDRAVLLPATLAAGAVIALIVAAWLWMNWGALTQIIGMLQRAREPLGQDQAAALFTGVMGLILSTFLLLVPTYVAAAAYEAACLRWMIRGEAPGLFGLRLDYDTWRIYGIYWCWVIAQMAVSTAASMLMIPFMFMMMGDVIAQGPELDPQIAWDMQVKMNAISMLQYIPLAFIAVRFSPAAATSIARRRFSFFEAWKVTEDRFFALFGSWAVLWLLFALAHAVLFATTYGVLFGDLWMRLLEDWRNLAQQETALPSETFRLMIARAMSRDGMMLIGAAYVGGLILWTAYALLSFGVNARAALAALDEEKIREEPPES